MRSGAIGVCAAALLAAAAVGVARGSIFVAANASSATLRVDGGATRS